MKQPTVIHLETWRAVAPEDENGQIILYNDRDEIIACLPLGTDGLESDAEYNALDRRARTYATLMEATPDLLGALIDLVERDRAEAVSCGFSDDQMTWLDPARRAIAKALKD